MYQPKKEIKDSKVPIALTTFLKANSHIKTIVMHLDNDKTGRLCTATLKELLKKAEKDKLLDALMGKPMQKEENAPENPSVAKTEKSPLSEPLSEKPSKSAEGGYYD